MKAKPTSVIEEPDCKGSDPTSFVESEIGSFPRSWEVCSVSKLGTAIQSGQTPSRQNTANFGNDTPWVKTGDLTERDVWTTEERLSDDGLKSIGGKVRPPGTVMVAMYGGAGTIGKCGVLRISAATNQAVCCIEPNSERFISNFLLYYFIHTRKAWMMHAIGTRKDPNISKGIIERCLVPLPPLLEQQKIAAVLGVVQRTMEQQERLLALTAELKKTLLHQLFTQGLRHEPQKQTDIGPVPESWEVLPLSECATVQTGAAKGRNFKDHETIEAPYLRVANVQSGYLDLTEMKTITIQAKEQARYALQDGDIVLTEGGDFDKLGRGFIWRGQIKDCVHQNHVFAVRVDRKKLLPEFFAHQSQSPYGKAYFLSVAHKTTNLACINTTKLKAFPVLIPSMEQQQEMVSALESVDAKLSTIRRKHATLTALFRTLLHQLMTAQIRVHHTSFRFDP